MQMRRVRNASVLMILGLPGVIHASDVTPVVRVNWRDRPIPKGCVVLPGDEDVSSRQLKVVNSVDAPMEFVLYTIDASSLETSEFFVSGMVRWENCAGMGELGLACEYDDGSIERHYDSNIRRGSFYRRIMGGSGDWGQYAIGPGRCRSDRKQLRRFSLILRIPGPGTFYLGPSQVFEGDRFVFWYGQPGEWWGTGSFTVSLLPLVMINIVLGMVIFRRKAESALVIKRIWMLAGACAALGIVGLAMGVVAFAMGQPFHVWLNCVFYGLFAGAFSVGWLRRARGIDSTVAPPGPVQAAIA